MTAPTRSYLAVSYDLRPAKQVQRRMIIDVLMRLSVAGFPIGDYQYTGLGSIYFVDHMLFHRYLGVKRLLSVEYDLSIAKRIEFNKPFSLVDIEMKPIGEVIPSLDPDLSHILWLDYDSRLHREIIEDVQMASYELSTGSILLVTVDVNRPKFADEVEEWAEYYRDQAGDFFDLGWTDADFSLSRLPGTNALILHNAIQRGLVARMNTAFLPLFKFVYADGHTMLTVGGMIGTDVERRKLAAADLEALPFARLDRSDAPYRISVPLLTRKERLYLDSHMPCGDSWTPEAFELDRERVCAYRDIYRFYPIYAELLL